MKCPKCNSEVPDGTKFCPECGHKFEIGKKCPQCGKMLAAEAKFCLECGYNFNAPAAASGGVSMGDKNVIAGDVVHGSQDNSKYYGNVSNSTTNNTNTVNTTTNNTVINQDETRKVVSCHICGRNVTFDQAISCPKCQQITCSDCYDFSIKLCKACIASQKKEKDEVYKQRLFHVFEDGLISAQERGELLQLQAQLGISDEHALELENLCKAECSSGKTNAAKPLSMFEKMTMDKVKTLLWENGSSKDAWGLINTVYQQHRFDEDVLSLRIQCAQMILPPDQLRTCIQEVRADIPAVYLAAVDLALQEGDLNEAENRLAAAEQLWPKNYQVICRRALYSLAMADALNEESLVQVALGVIMEAPEPTEKLDRSWQAKTMNSIAVASGDAPEQITPEGCRAQDLYFGIASTIFTSKAKRDRLAQEEENRKKLSPEYTELAKKMLNGNGVVQDPVKAAEMLKQAAELGNVSAQNLLGVCYEKGAGVPKNQPEAIRWYRKAAEQGDVSAQCNLALCYANGTGVAKDDTEAAKWYRKAAEQGECAAQNKLAQFYDKGTGVAKDQGEAVKWYRKAAEQGFVHAQYNLGLCYMSGTGVAEDDAEAAKWFGKAAEQGLGEAKDALEKIAAKKAAAEKAAEEKKQRIQEEKLAPVIQQYCMGEDYSIKPDAFSMDGNIYRYPKILSTNAMVKEFILNVSSDEDSACWCDNGVKDDCDGIECSECILCSNNGNPAEKINVFRTWCEHLDIPLPSFSTARTNSSQTQVEMGAFDEFEQMLAKIHDAKIFSKDTLDSKKLANAIAEYAHDVSESDVLVQVDDTVFGSAKDGCLITKDKIYVKDVVGTRQAHISAKTQWGLKKGILSKAITMDGSPIFSYTQPDTESMEKLVAALNVLVKSLQ